MTAAASRRIPQEPVALLLAGVGLPEERPAVPQPQAPAPHPLDRAVEALLMVAAEPLPLVTIAQALDRPVAVVRDSVERLVADYDGDAGGPRRGFELRAVGNGWRVYVRAEFDGAVRDLVTTQLPARLSQAALETLAVIAYKQPVTRGQIASVRAVNVDGVVRTLLARGLIEERGHDDETGAVLYGTTSLLLEHLGLASLDELPHLSPLLADQSEVADALV